MKRNFIFLLLGSCLFAVNAIAQKSVDEGVLRQWISTNAVKLNLSANDIQNTRISNYYFDKNANAVIAYLQQTFKGVDVYNAITTVAFRDGKAISVASSRIPGFEKRVKNEIAVPIVSPEEAVRTAASSVQLTLIQPVGVPLEKDAVRKAYIFDKLGIASNNITSGLLWSPDETTGTFHLSWEVSIHALKKNDLWMVKVDALNGKVLVKDNFTVSCVIEAKHPVTTACITKKHYAAPASVTGTGMLSSAKYNVIPYPFSDPDFAAPTVVSNPWELFPNTDATTLKWHNDNNTHAFDSTRGNNVLVQEDRDGNNGYGYGAQTRAAFPNLDFNYTFTDTAAVEFGNNQKFSMTNLFYWNNMIHDMLYQYGFDEVAGNFQANNLSRGGSGNDYVLADAQDGSGLNNANFATPSDGQSPRMQMFLFSHQDPTCTVNAPEDLQGTTTVAESGFSSNNKLGMTGPITGDVVYYMDSAKDKSHSACVAAFNANELKGKIAYIIRGGCDFVVKVKNAQKAGAIAAIVMNNVAGSPITMGGTDNSITIPAVMISQDDGFYFMEQLDMGVKVNVTLKAGVYRDGSMDNGIVSHEYFHGVSNRLTGGPKNVSCLRNKEQMGEGWSDFGALMMTTDWSKAKTTDGTKPRGMGNYAVGADTNGAGIRWYPYSTDMSINPWVYKDVKGAKIDSESHNIGEVWCAILWDMTWNIINADGINPTFWDASKPGGNTVAMQLVMQGMKLQKCSPGFVSGRDGILKADTLLYDGKYSPLIWMSFAKRGVGYSASEGSENILGDLVDAYDLPPALPAIWDQFTAEKVNVSGLLKWSTLTEQNVDRYAIERSEDGSNYIEIGSVKAKGNSTVKQSYSFTDLKPMSGNNVYRIRSVDHDGKFSYSEARTLNFGLIKNSISVSPNPAHNLAVISLRNNVKPLKVLLFNSMGQQLGSYNMNNESLTIDVSKLNAGTYFINIKGDNINHREKLIVQ